MYQGLTPEDAQEMLEESGLSPNITKLIGGVVRFTVEKEIGEEKPIFPKNFNVTVWGIELAPRPIPGHGVQYQLSLTVDIPSFAEDARYPTQNAQITFNVGEGWRVKVINGYWDEKVALGKVVAFEGPV